MGDGTVPESHHAFSFSKIPCRHFICFPRVKLPGFQELGLANESLVARQIRRQAAGPVFLLAAGKDIR